MSNFNSRLNQVNSGDMLGAALGDGIMAGLIGGMLGLIFPILGLFARNSSMVSLGFFVNIFLYFMTGILAGYLFYSRKSERRWVAVVVAIIGGFLAGLISGAAFGLAFSQVSQSFSQLGSSISWVAWSLLSGLGAGFLAPLTAWIPGFFMPSNNRPYKASNSTSRVSAKGANQPAPIADVFERRRKIRFVVTMVSILLMFAIYFCRVLSH